jgi:3alpha(or 20beta)-hydroxysteroid dehydrogenase
MGQLSGKVAIVTGAAGGLGSAIATLFASEGAAVAVADVRPDRGEPLAAQIRAQGGTALYIDCDVASEEAWSGAVASVERWRGGLNVLVNNAGINDRRGVLDSDVRSWRALMAVNVDGPFYGIRAVAPTMRRAGGGAIVNIASTSALEGHVFVAYATSKWALRGLSRSAALELAVANIRVNTVCPGVMITNINRDQPYLSALINSVPIGRAATTDEIARLVLWLASDTSSYVTGQDFVADGGMTAGRSVVGAVKA